MLRYLQTNGGDFSSQVTDKIAESGAKGYITHCISLCPAHNPEHMDLRDFRGQRAVKEECIFSMLIANAAVTLKSFTSKEGRKKKERERKEKKEMVLSQGKFRESPESLQCCKSCNSRKYNSK